MGSIPITATMNINTFKGAYFFLSNFYPCEVLHDSVLYKSVEHAYQAAKTDVPDEKRYIAASKNAAEAKRRGRTVHLIAGWESSKVDIMRKLLVIKFANEYLEQMLMQTDSYIEEGNWWGDSFWGVDSKTGFGYNILGKLIMEIRSEKKLRNS